tara:strand:+ start:130839 stop:131528 length:690 start_codon:yes stop_codon:yes gene_type:complete
VNPEPNSIYRTPDCSYGDKAVKLLKDKNIDFEDHILKSQEELSELKNQYGVKTTPQVFIEGERVGGYSELAEKFGENTDMEETSYVPVIAVFSVALLLTLSTGFGVMGFMGFSLSLLAMLKLMDVESFVDGFVKYDLIAQTRRSYGKIYPYLELAIGLSFLSGVLINLGALLAIGIGFAGGYSIYKAIYIEKKDLNCACIGGGSKAPLGVVSISENAIMALMGIGVLLA